MSFNDGSYNYAIIDTTSVKISSGISTSGAVVLPSSATNPSTLTTYTVASIGLNAFAYNTSITSVFIPNTIEQISSHAFWNCSNITSVIFQDGLQYIGNKNSIASPGGAFHNCTSLKSLNIPASVKTISEGTFLTCTSLLTVRFYGTTLPSMYSNVFEGSGAATGYYLSTATNVNSITTESGNKPLTSFFTNTQAIAPIVCFKEDSKILTDKGYVSVQNLRKGDLVKTLLNGFVPVYIIGKKTIHHGAFTERIKDQLYVCSKEEYPEVFEELVITGCHSILVDNFKSDEEKRKADEVNGRTCVTDKKYRLPACVDKRTRVYETRGDYTIYHFALENDDYFMNYGVYANGLLVETCSKRYLKELSNMELL